MRVVFFGTPAFAVPSLDALLAAGIEVAAVVTQPDRARGRSRSTLLPPAVKVRAEAAGLTVLQPERPSGDVFHQTMRNLEADLGIVVAYGHLLRPELLEIPPLGMVNVHASVLPRWRGAAPIQWAILSGDRESGVTIMRVEAGLDTGSAWLTRRIPIGATETAGALTERIAHLGAEALLEVLPRIVNGVTPMAQAESGVTLAPKIGRTDARIVWDVSAEEACARIRAMDPAPGAWTSIRGVEVKCFSPEVLPTLVGQGHAPGAVVAVGASLIVATRNGNLAIHEVQPAGRRRMPAGDWVRGGAVHLGEQCS